MGNPYRTEISFEERYEFCKLVDSLIMDIQHLEKEVVKLRYELSGYLSAPEREALQCDILRDLAGRYAGTAAYDTYIQLFYNNQDPMASDEWVRSICTLAHIAVDFED